MLATTNRTTNLVILEQACSWPAKRQSFAIFGHLATAQRTRHRLTLRKRRQVILVLWWYFFPHTADVLSCRQEMVVNLFWFILIRKRIWSFSAQLICGIDISNLLRWIIRSLEQEIRQSCLINARMFHEIRPRLDQTNLLVFSSYWVLVLK